MLVRDMLAQFSQGDIRSLVDGRTNRGGVPTQHPWIPAGMGQCRHTPGRPPASPPRLNGGLAHAKGLGDFRLGLRALRNSRDDTFSEVLRVSFHVQ